MLPVVPKVLWPQLIRRSPAHLGSLVQACGAALHDGDAIAKADGNALPLERMRILPVSLPFGSFSMETFARASSPKIDLAYSFTATKLEDLSSWLRPPASLNCCKMSIPR